MKKTVSGPAKGVGAAYAWGGNSEVSRSISGPMPFVSKIMCVFLNMDKMIGAEFDRGLSDLKTLAEK